MEEKAIELLGEDTVEKLKEQHQDYVSNGFKELKRNQWSHGETAYYEVKSPKNGKLYKVCIVDNVLVDPLYINIIENIEEI